LRSVLFQPINLGGCQLSNRITMAPTFVAYNNFDGTVSDATLEHYRDMGAGGAGMVVVENCIIDHERSWFGRLLRVDHDNFLPGLTKLSGVIKEGGAAAFCQINHGGRYSTNPNLIAPSPIRAFDWPEPREMTLDDIKEVIQMYAQAALRVKRAGFNGVEIHGATGYLPAQFLSPRTNKRNDRYGGSLENRMRFGLELVQAVKDAVGAGYPVGYRFMADEWMNDGLQLTEAKVYAAKLSAVGVSYLSVTAGLYESMFTEDKIDLSGQENYMVDYAGAIKEVVNIPVVAAGRIATPAAAERVINSGQADLIGLSRVLLADPEWPRKAKEERDHEINLCRTKCDSCLSLVMQQKPAICAAWNVERKKKFRALLDK